MQLSYRLSSDFFVRLVLIAFLVSYIISFPLWGNHRSFPLFPVFDTEFKSNFFSNALQYGFLLLGIFCFFITKRRVIITFLINLGLLICLDQLRLQPWVYFLSLCLIPFTFRNKESDFREYLRWLFIILYFWSGIHKLNSNFTSIVFESILVDGFKISDILVISELKKFAFTFPVIETSISFLLLLKKTRKLGLVFLIFTHLFIVYYLVLGTRGNYVILPWNLFMMINGFLLFNNKDTFLKLPQHIVLKSILMIVSFLPVGFLFGKLDQTVSFSLYDGKLKSLYALSERTEESRNNISKKLIKKGAIKDFNAWSFNELKFPFYPEKRFIQRLQKSKISSYSTFLLTERPLYERNLTGKFKTPIELKNYKQFKKIESIVFTKELYLLEFKIIK